MIPAEVVEKPQVVTTLWCGYCGAPFNTEHKVVCKEITDAI